VAIRQTTICCSAGALIALSVLSAHAQTPTTTSRAVKQTRSADDKTPLSLFPLAPVWTLALNNELTAPPAFHDMYGVFALEGDQLAAYELSTGSRLWLTSIATAVEPVIGEAFVFVAEDGAIAALALRTGDVVWRRPFDAELATGPIIAGDHLILTTLDGDVVAVRASDGEETWRRHLPRAASSRPAATGSRLFVPTADNQILALSLKDGAVIWSRLLGGVGHDILAGDDRIFLGSQDRFFYCLNAKTGAVEWRWQTGADAIGLPVVDERTVYVVSLDNVLRGLNRSSGVQRWKAPLTFRPLSGPLKFAETLIVAGTTPELQAYSSREGKPLGRYGVSSALDGRPHLFVDPERVFPVLATVSSDIVGHATVTAATRDLEPPNAPIAPLPNLTVLQVAPDAPKDLGEVSPLPNLIPVVPLAEP
jgi:outer membrane protein assembly factor BamB